MTQLWLNLSFLRFCEGGRGLGCPATLACCCSALVGAVCRRAPPSCFRMLEIPSPSNVAPQYVHRHFSIRHMHTYITCPYAELFINRENQTACKAGKAATVPELGTCPFPAPGTGLAQPTNPEALLNLPALLRAKSTLLHQRLGLQSSSSRARETEEAREEDEEEASGCAWKPNCNFRYKVMEKRIFALLLLQGGSNTAISELICCPPFKGQLLAAGFRPEATAWST